MTAVIGGFFFFSFLFFFPAKYRIKNSGGNLTKHIAFRSTAVLRNGCYSHYRTGHTVMTDVSYL